MSLSSTGNRVSYAGNGVTTAFAFPFLFLANADLIVIKRVNSTGVETTQTITTHYTVTGAGVASGGTVTMITAPATGETLIIYRDPAQTQLLDLVENDPMPAEELEKGYDKLTMITQRLDDRLDRALVLSDGDTAVAMVLPNVVTRASKFLSFDASGLPIAASSVSTTIVVSSFAETFLDDTSAAAVRTTLGLTREEAEIILAVQVFS